MLRPMIVALAAAAFVAGSPAFASDGNAAPSGSNVPSEVLAGWTCEGKAAELDASGNVKKSEQICRKGQDLPKEQQLSHFDKKWSCDKDSANGAVLTVCRKFSRGALALNQAGPVVSQGSGFFQLVALPLLAAGGAAGGVAAGTSGNSNPASP